MASADGIKIHWEYVPPRAEVKQLDNLSAHAGRGEILDWLSHFPTPPKQAFITHGEPDASDVLRKELQEALHWSCRVPEHMESVELS